MSHCPQILSNYQIPWINLYTRILESHFFYIQRSWTMAMPFDNSVAIVLASSLTFLSGAVSAASGMGQSDTKWLRRQGIGQNSVRPLLSLGEKTCALDWGRSPSSQGYATTHAHYQILSAFRVMEHLGEKTMRDHVEGIPDVSHFARLFCQRLPLLNSEKTLADIGSAIHYHACWQARMNRHACHACLTHRSGMLIRIVSKKKTLKKTL